MINLLPPEIKNRQKLRSGLYSLTTVYVIIAAVLVLGSGLVATYNLTLTGTISDFESKLEQLRSQKSQNRDLIEQLGFVQSRVTVANQYQEKTDWNSYLDAIASSVPSSVRLTTLSLQGDAATGQSFNLIGETSERRDVLLFKDKLAQDKKFQKVAIQSLTENLVLSGKFFAFTINVTLAKGTE